MPSVKNPGLLTPRAGQVPAKTVPSAGLIQPNRDIEPLKAHLHDPNRAHMASAIGIVDAGGFFESDDVEGALQEVGTTGDYTRQSGVVVGSTTSVVGLNLVVAASSFVLLRGNVREVSGLTAVIPVTAGTYYAYINSAVTLQISATLPNITNNDVVLLSKVVVSGTTTLSDARFFVARLDRKLDLTLRSEAIASDNAAEACFVTIEAALFWLENITQDVKKTLLIRGNLTLTDTLVLPTSDVTIRGEGSASITLDTAVQIAIDLNGQDNTTIENVSFVCNSTTGNTIAIYDADAAGLSNLVITDCNFYSGVTNWSGYAIYLGGFGTGTYSRVSIERCLGSVFGHGVYVYNPFYRLVIKDCEFTNSSPVNSGLYCFWIDKGAGFPNMVLTIENCIANAFEFGVYTFGATTVIGVINNCKFLGVVGGVVCSDPFVVSGCEIVLNATYGLYGVLCGEGTTVKNCSITTTRAPAAYTTDHAAGVYAYSRCVVDGCYISGFRTTANYRADGVLILPSFTGDQSYNKIVNNHFVDSAVYAFSDPSDPQNGLTVQGNTFESTTTTSLPYGAISANGQSNFIISDNVIRCNTSANPVGGFSYGVEIKSGDLTLVGFPYDAGYSFNAIVKNNVITSPRYSGVYVYGFASQVDISGNTIDGFVSANPKEPSAYGVHFSANTTAGSTGTGICRESSISSNRLTRLYSGIYLNGTATYKSQAVKIADNAVSYCAYINGAAYNVLYFTNSGSKGIGVEYATDISITDNNVSNIGVMLLDDGSTLPPSDTLVASNGIYIWNTYPAQVEGNVITGLNATKNADSHGINAVVISGVGVLGERDIRIANNTLELLQAPLVSGTATAGAIDTLTDSTKTWTVNAYTNCIVTITSGTGSGQTRYIASNTANILTVNANWGTNPDGTSVYEILQSQVNGKAAIRHIQRQAGGASGFIGLQVEGNRIYTHESTSAQDPFEYGIWLDGENSTLGATYSDTRICNNTIHGWSDAADKAGILVSGDSTTGALNFVGACVDHNTLFSTTTGVVDNAAIFFSGRNGELKNSSFSGNNVCGEDEILVTADAIKINAPISDVKSLKINNNRLTANAGVRINHSNSTKIFSNLSVSSNQFNCFYAVDITTTSDANEFKIENNSGVGIDTSDGIITGVTLTCLDYHNVSISGNTFLLSKTSTPATGVEFISLGDRNPSVGLTSLQNLKIDNNQISISDVSVAILTSTRGIDVSINESASGISVCNNDINFENSSSSSTIQADCGIRLRTNTTYASKSWKGVKVCNNSIKGVFTASGSYPENGALVIDLEPTALTYLFLYNALISGNRACGLPYDQATYVSHGFYMKINNAAISGYAVSITDNAFIEFVDAGVGTCAQFVGTVPANSICQSNISQDGSYVISDSGTADAGSSTYTVVDAAKTWTVNEHAGRYVKLIFGTGVPQFCRITSNTPTVLTVSPGWIVPPGAATDYEIRRYNGFSGFGTGAASGFSPELIPDFNIDY